MAGKGEAVTATAAAGVCLALWVAAALWAAKLSCAEGAPPGVSPAATVDINSADAATLEALPGIGPTLSRRIVEERRAGGPYGRPEDLLRVRGVTPELVERIRRLVRAGCPQGGEGDGR
jgi:DNA uptake protein ComE-like DNA-binding protein